MCMLVHVQHILRVYNTCGFWCNWAPSPTCYRHREKIRQESTPVLLWQTWASLQPFLLVVFGDRPARSHFCRVPAVSSGSTEKCSLSSTFCLLLCGCLLRKGEDGVVPAPAPSSNSLQGHPSTSQNTPRTPVDGTDLHQNLRPSAAQMRFACRAVVCGGLSLS